MRAPSPPSWSRSRPRSRPRSWPVATLGTSLALTLLVACGDAAGPDDAAPHDAAPSAHAAPDARAAQDAQGAQGVQDVQDAQASADTRGAGRAAGWRLADEASPYLRAHADNPVAWYPWGEEAFALAKELDRPILLSIGYSSCHWCHVMEHETFEDEACAQLIDAHFVAVKVDREERPDVDAVYMDALLGMTGGGGWPLTMFLTPEGHPIWGGTYFPAEGRDGLPGFRDVLASVHQAWTTQREGITGDAASIVQYMRRELPPAADAWDPAALLDAGTLALTSGLDATRGGTHGAPKFPPASLVSFLLGQHQRSGVTVLELLDTTLDAMAGGGLMDQLAGGFHRYSVDEAWRVPHFEKMLYDNALLAAVYAEAAAVSGEARHAWVARQTLRWMRDALRLPSGLYAGALDADSLPYDGQRRPLPDARPEEGLAYVWTPAELLAALGEEDGRRMAQLYGVTLAGTFEGGRSVLAPMATREALARAGLQGVGTGEAFLAWLDDARARLLAVRATRPQPFRDEKCLAGWNGLALTAFARGAALLGDADLREDTADLAAALRARLIAREPFALAHQWFEDAASGRADLFDHAAVARGLLDAHAVLGDPELLADAFRLAQQIVARFEDPQGGFFDTDAADALLPARAQDPYDGSVPSGASLALELLERLSPLDDAGTLRAAADRAWLRYAPALAQVPAAFPALLRAVDHARGPLAEIVLDGTGPEADALHARVLATPLPAALVIVGPGRVAQALSGLVPEEPSLLADRRAPDGAARAWVCVDRTCLLPADDEATLAEQLRTVVPRR